MCYELIQFQTSKFKLFNSLLLSVYLKQKNKPLRLAKSLKRKGAIKYGLNGISRQSDLYSDTMYSNHNMKCYPKQAQESNYKTWNKILILNQATNRPFRTGPSIQIIHSNTNRIFPLSLMFIVILKKCFFSLKAFCGLVFGLHSDFSQDHDYSRPKQGMFHLHFALSSEQKCCSRKKCPCTCIMVCKALGFQFLS